MNIKGKAPNAQSTVCFPRSCRLRGTTRYVFPTKGIVHRDLKPANIFLLQQEVQKGQGAQEGADFVKIVDFGLATARSLISAEQARDSLQELRDHALTQAGALMGTPLYMSPENITLQVSDGDFGLVGGWELFWD